MSKIISFPKVSRRDQGVESLEHQEGGDAFATEPPGGVSAWLFNALRTVFFLVLYWLRGPILWVCGVVSILALLAFLITLYAYPSKQSMVWGLGILSFLAFVIQWAYDEVLLMLSPRDVVRQL